MSFQISYFSTGKGIQYGSAALAYISGSSVSPHITNTANTLGVSATAIADAMTAGANSYYTHSRDRLPFDIRLENILEIG
ncbi:hypothetical protein [Pseudothauera rhizosphaerae]|uniref:Uncharacterized protein n=1 Tax=Pseudothauera rhizosphaerae TaxID=2565932 RepID=A0A4S4AYZ7_9RHOO|nr:hypothetical protein [Pseudothauera rhizosphaerae]THF65233.1 hypothetical protein E6O51_01125 [Pseudothauera rhizosphaerae]